jgi:TRAP-type C4-dicarboxylate transport system permease large subunit
MPSALEIAGDVASASAALAGLILVFLGAIGTSFDGYQPQEQRTVKSRYQRRAWFAFVGLTLALLAVLLALVGKWTRLECAAVSSLFLLFVSLVWVLLAALSAVREIK